MKYIPSGLDLKNFRVVKSCEERPAIKKHCHANWREQRSD